MSEKIQKVLANYGLASRREIERWIADGRISVNGQLAKLGDRVEETDSISVDGRKVKRAQETKTRVLIYNKPEGEVVTRADPEGRRSVFDSLPPLTQSRWVAVGRLDINTSGLLLFTNNGELANALMHPSSHLHREYAVRVFGDVSTQQVKNLVTGVRLEDGMARFEDVVGGSSGGANRWFHVVVAMGRNRIVRRLWESQGLTVSRLMRVRFGPVVMPDKLHIGRYQDLDQRCIVQLQDAVSKNTE